MFLVCAFATAIALGAETNLTLAVDGVTYHDVRFGRATPTSVTVFHSTGVATIPLAKLPPELQKQFGYDPQQAAAWQAAQQKAAAEAADAQRKAAAAVEWELTVERVLPDGIIAYGHKSNAAGDQMTICLVDDPHVGELAEGNRFTAQAYKEGVITINGRTLEEWVYYEPTVRLTTQPPAASHTAPPVAPTPAPPTASSAPAMTLDELTLNGVFGFPQTEARVLCNRPALRVSVWNNEQYLVAQAVLWTIHDSSPDMSADRWKARHTSELWLDLDADGKMTAQVDREYQLGPQPYQSGMYYQICMGRGGRSGLKRDSQGWGAIRHIAIQAGKRSLPGARPIYSDYMIRFGELRNLVRVDTYVIPLAELNKKVGDKIRICYWGRSKKPLLTVSSLGDEYNWVYTQNEGYFNMLSSGEFRLARGHVIDVTEIPDGRHESTSVP
jgi:hypothetical protein